MPDVGAASSRDHLIPRLEAAPTRGFYGNLVLPPDKRLIEKRICVFQSTNFGGSGGSPSSTLPGKMMTVDVPCARSVSS